MIDSHEFLRFLIDSVTEHITVIDHKGLIQFVNKPWIEFGKSNNCLVNKWKGVNYLKVCDESAARGEKFGENAVEGIKKVIDRELQVFFMEYPCHSHAEKRWFMMRVTPFQYHGVFYYVISHQSITERKLAEEEVLSLSRIDGLTKIPNRRFFDQFLEAEWKRCNRLNLPIVVAMMDIDHFKLLNDYYGHQAGDDCLITIGAILNKFGKRPGDLFARYGGEEFSFVFGNTTIDQSMVVMNRIMNSINEHKIPNEKSPTEPIVTVSIGLAMMYPNNQCNEKKLIGEADKLLYSAKENGRNRIDFQ